MSAQRREALWYRRLDDGAVQCELCPHRCVIAPGEAGICRVRRNEGGTLLATSYGQTVSLSVDPVEKKPLYHFLPGKPVVSIGHNGCNLRCSFCQNYSISQLDSPHHELPLESLPGICRQKHSPALAFTYTEPITWYEYVLDASKLLHEHGVRTIMVSNGFISPEPLDQIIPHIDAWNIDLKAMSDGFYGKLCGARLDPVLETIRRVHGRCHLELTNLVITGENDSAEQTERLIDFIASLDASVPVHFSRYFPQYKLTAPATPESALRDIYTRAKRKLNFVYLGNMRTADESDTHCPQCGSLLVRRDGYETAVVGIMGGMCGACGRLVEGVWA
ncbi:MAG: AmmeMemoRadiSam system radical SAM enzyme [Candidatus Cloacimonetes bacterium]|nr:AmmeMemoRadiSam system radical SAM enzyme [Candidatus Cloacimonadota bacterium]